jgi:hypothetical protein
MREREGKRGTVGERNVSLSITWRRSIVCVRTYRLDLASEHRSAAIFVVRMWLV